MEKKKNYLNEEMKNKKTMKTLVSQNLEFLELSDEELLSVVGGKKTEDSNSFVSVTAPGGVAFTVNEPPQGEIILDPVNQTVTIRPDSSN